MAFVSLHNHDYSSNIRFLDCINRPEEMINKAINLGFSGIAFTNHESLSSAVTILKIRDKIKEDHPDFKIIFGNEIYLIDESEIKNTNKYYHFILLAKDEIGWQQLKTLSSRAWERGYTEKGIMRVPTTYQDIEEVVGSNPGHLVASTGCLGGFLDNAILEKNNDKVNWFIPWLIASFGKENVQLEMQSADSEEQIMCNKFIIRLAQYFDLPYIVTTDSHYLDKEDFTIHSAFLNSKQSSDRETEKFYKYTYIQTEEEMKEILMRGGLTEAEVQTAFDNTVKIAEAVTDYDFRHSTIVPGIKLPDFKVNNFLQGWYNKYPILQMFATTSNKEDNYLLYQIEEGLQQKHVSVNETVVARIAEELDVINYISGELKQSISAYLNLVKEIVDICWELSFVGAGRGSSGCFLVNYLIGITQTNPLDYDIPSFRFLNKARADALPDIDIDIAPAQTDAIIELLKQHFGENNVIQCATFKTESLKAAILDACRGLGINNDEAQSLAATVPSKRGQTYSLQDCLEGNEEKGLEPVPGFEKKFDNYPHLMDTIKKVEGLPMNASIHASAVYIFNNGYLEHNSLMRAPNGKLITAFNMHDSDDMGALKFDLLKTDAETKLMKAMDLLIKFKQIEWQGSLRSTYDKYLHPQVLVYNNQDMWIKASNHEISDCFQLETMVGQVGMKTMQPRSVSELAAVNGLIRLMVAPGEESPVERYARFKKNISLWYSEMNDAGLTQHQQEILKKHVLDKFGVAYSQEDLMRILMDPEISNFTLKEADKARKTVAKKHLDEIEQLKKRFFEDEEEPKKIDNSANIGNNKFGFDF